MFDVRDHENKSHQIIQLELQDQATTSQIKDELRSKFGINGSDQELLDSNNQRIPENGGIGDKNTLILEHVLLGNREEFLRNRKIFNDIKLEKSKRNTKAHEAITNSEKLEKTGFFRMYVKFVGEWTNIIGQQMRFIDRTNFALQQSVKAFFSSIFPDSQIDFDPKQGGSRAGVVVNVTRINDKTKYFMKTYHNAGPSMCLQNTAKRHLPDGREIFAYRILELIQVGPAVFFPYYARSRYIHYIATEEVCEFIELEKLEDVNAQKKVVVEAYLLFLILGLRDLNEGNTGLNQEKNMCIFDFMIADIEVYLRSQMLDDYKNKNILQNIRKASTILTGIGAEERMQIAEDALPRWDRINSMTRNVIDSERIAKS